MSSENENLRLGSTLDGPKSVILDEGESKSEIHAGLSLESKMNLESKDGDARVYSPIIWSEIKVKIDSRDSYNRDTSQEADTKPRRRSGDTGGLRSPLAEPAIATSSFHTTVKVGEEILRPGGLMIQGQVPGSGIIMVAPRHSPHFTSRCKLVLMEKYKSGKQSGFQGSLLDAHGGQLLIPGMAPDFDFALCVHLADGAEGGLGGIKTMGAWPHGTGLLLIPVVELMQRGIYKRLRVPLWYMIQGIRERNECITCGMRTVLGSDVSLHVCKMCKVNKYCSVTCQADDWKTGHSKVCSESFKKETRFGHWCVKYSMRCQELTTKNFPPERSEDLVPTSVQGSVVGASMDVSSSMALQSLPGSVTGEGSQIMLGTGSQYEVGAPRLLSDFIFPPNAVKDVNYDMSLEREPTRRTRLSPLRDSPI